MGCKLLEIMADGLYAVFHRFEAFIKKKVDAQALTVGCPSNGRRPSSISTLPAPAAQTSAGGTACSLLPSVSCAVAQASPPHRTPITGLAIPLLTHTCCYSPAMADEPVNPRTIILPSAWETTAESSLPPRRPLPRPRRRPPPWCSRRGVVNVVKERLPSDVDCTRRGCQLGPWLQHGSASLLCAK